MEISASRAQTSMLERYQDDAKQSATGLGTSQRPTLGSSSANIHGKDFETDQDRHEQDELQTRSNLNRAILPTASKDEYLEHRESYPKTLQLKKSKYEFSPKELKNLLNKADWKDGNDSLRNLNSLLQFSVKTKENRERSLQTTYKGRLLALHINGRPLSISDTDIEQCAKDEVVVNHDLLLAVSYKADCQFSSNRKKMLFTPLGYILTKLESFDKWISTGLVLVAEIQVSGRCKDLYLINSKKDSNSDEEVENSLRKNALGQEQLKALQGFQSQFDFTLAKVGKGLDLLETSIGKPPANAKTTTITPISTLTIDILQTGSRLERRLHGAFAFALAGGSGASD